MTRDDWSPAPKRAGLSRGTPGHGGTHPGTNLILVRLDLLIFAYFYVRLKLNEPLGNEPGLTAFWASAIVASRGVPCRVRGPRSLESAERWDLIAPGFQRLRGTFVEVGTPSSFLFPRHPRNRALRELNSRRASLDSRQSDFAEVASCGRMHRSDLKRTPRM